MGVISKSGQTLVFDLTWNLRSAGKRPYTYGIFDCAIYLAALRYFTLPFKCYRCLQHVKKNVKSESKKKNRETGVTRLRPVNRELLGPIIDWIEFSAPLPVGPEFTAFWESILDRMKNARCETDWNEPEMAEYLLKFI